MLLLSAHDECCSVTISSIHKILPPSRVLHASVSRLNGPRSAGSSVVLSDLIGGQKASSRPHHGCARSAHHKTGSRRRRSPPSE
ncbi:Homeobox-leucine zipper protein [Musa troglodytarum]|uniref:Homeobox-leucine zipper protein n=1 Tax=Musa troglodytarum TaxID=320322 RepID=A0A9E7JNV9_9LILI|nr:Homeobox-leucine zipper protein [Musa troglodytarum]